MGASGTRPSSHRKASAAESEGSDRGFRWLETQSLRVHEAVVKSLVSTPDCLRCANENTELLEEGARSEETSALARSPSQQGTAPGEALRQVSQQFVPGPQMAKAKPAGRQRLAG